MIAHVRSVTRVSTTYTCFGVRVTVSPLCALPNTLDFEPSDTCLDLGQAVALNAEVCFARIRRIVDAIIDWQDACSRNALGCSSWPSLDCGANLVLHRRCARHEVRPLLLCGILLRAALEGELAPDADQMPAG